MAKFIRGPFETIEEVKVAVQALHSDGYQKDAITIIGHDTNKLADIDDKTDLAVKDSEKKESLEDRLPLWQRLADTFTGYFFNEDYRRTYGDTGVDNTDDDAEAMLAGYREDLEDGKIVILVDDILGKESKLNLDALDPGTEPAEKDVPPAEAMDDIKPESDSHPDIDETEDVLRQETTYIPSESMDTYGAQHSTPKYHDIPDEIDVTPIPPEEDKNL